MAKKIPQKPLETVEIDVDNQPMAREERIYEAQLLPSGTSEALDPDAEASFQDWAEALGESRSGYMLRAYRLPVDDKGRVNGNANTGQMVFLDSWPLDSIRYDDLIKLLRSEYMLPGMQIMSVRLMVTKEGERGIKKNQIVTVQRALNSASAGAQPQQGRESVTELMRAMQEGMQAQLQQFQAALQMSRQNTPAPPQRDPMDSMVQMMGMFMPMIVAAIGRPQAAVTPGPGLGELADVMLKLKELGGDGGGDSDGGTVGMIRALAPLVQPVLQTVANESAARAQQLQNTNNVPQAAPVRRLANPAPVPQQNNAAPVQPAQSTQTPAPPAGQPMTFFNGGELPMLLLQMRPQIQQLCEMAASVPQPDPVQVAQMTMQGIPEEMDEALGDLLFNANFMAWLAQLDPRVNDHREWFDKLHAELKAAFDDPDAPATTGNVVAMPRT